MNAFQQFITIGMVVLGTQITRWLPFVALRKASGTSAFLHYLGRVLPPAIFGMLVIYCYRNLDFASAPYGVPEIVCGMIVAVLQLIFKNMGVSILLGTLTYILWLNFI